MLMLMPLLAYLAGSISTAILVCRFLGLADPRTEGSGNPGATNVLRTGGKTAAAATLIGDALKGWLPVACAAWLDASAWIIGLTALAAVIGHLAPVFFQFKGGKGVATALGAGLGVSLIAGLLALASWLAVAAAFRYSSLAAMCALAAMPFFIWISVKSVPLVLCSAAIAILVIIRHKSNLGRLLAGSEPRIGASRKR